MGHLLALDDLEQGDVQLLCEGASHHVGLSGLSKLEQYVGHPCVVEVGWHLARVLISSEDIKHESNGLDRLGNETLN